MMVEKNVRPRIEHFWCLVSVCFWVFGGLWWCFMVLTVAVNGLSDLDSSLLIGLALWIVSF